MIKTGGSVTVWSQKTFTCLGFRYDDETGEKVYCRAKVKGSRKCPECASFDERVASKNAAGHGHMQMRTVLATHIELDPWEI